MMENWNLTEKQQRERVVIDFFSDSCSGVVKGIINIFHVVGMALWWKSICVQRNVMP